MNVTRVVLAASTLVLFAFIARAVGQSAPSGSPLDGTSWQLVKFVGGDGQTLTPEDRSRYTISFRNDGRVSVRVDCNRGSGTWKSPDSNKLEFGVLALTRAMCPPAALSDRLAKDWQYVRSFTIKEGHLFLSLMADGGTYEFEPTTQTQQSLSKLRSPVASRGPVQWKCNHEGGSETVSATFYRTFPAMVLLERDHQSRPAFRIRSEVGAKYEGRDVSYWEERGEATVVWSAITLRCK